jgi:NAD+ kinase
LPALPKQAPTHATPTQLRRIVVYGNPDKPGVEALVKELVAWTRPRGVALSVAREIGAGIEGDGSGQAGGTELYEADNPAEHIFRDDEPALLLSLGGDGTMLHAIHRFWPLHAPVLGVNLGSLGFNASVLPGQMIETIERWLAGRTTQEERQLIQVRHLRGGRPFVEMVAVNDVVMIKTVKAHVIHLTLSQGEEVISSYPGDGLIVSTPTGSTGYNLSAGGPIVHPSLHVAIATAICPHTLAARPVVLSLDPPLEMRFKRRHASDRVMLWIDGQEPWPVEQDDEVRIEADAIPLRLVSGQGYQYFNQLRQKLLWNVENRPADQPQ